MAMMDAPVGHMVLINTFQVDPDRSEQLVELLRDATETVFRHMPGFVSADLHISDDATRVVDCVQWRDRTDYLAMQANPTAREHFEVVGRLAKSSEPVMYQLRHRET